jgi:hypothetical protein
MTQKTKAKAPPVEPGWRRWNEDDARAALAELAKTEESAVAFARRKQISTQRLHYWKKRLKESPSASTPAFVAVTMPATQSSRSEIEIRVGAIAIVVRAGYDVEEISRLVEALSRRTRAC